MRIKFGFPLLIALALVLPNASFAKHPDKDFKFEEKQAHKDAKDQDKAYRKWPKVSGEAREGLGQIGREGAEGILESPEGC